MVAFGVVSLSVTDCDDVYTPVAGLNVGVAAVGVPLITPHAVTCVWLPAYTFPFATIGEVNLTAPPERSRLFGAWLLLYSILARLVASNAYSAWKQREA